MRAERATVGRRKKLMMLLVRLCKEMRNSVRTEAGAAHDSYFCLETEIQEILIFLKNPSELIFEE